MQKQISAEEAARNEKIVRSLADEIQKYLNSLTSKECDALGKAFLEERLGEKDPLTVFTQSFAALLAPSNDVKAGASAWAAVGYLTPIVVDSEAFLRNLQVLLNQGVSGIAASLIRSFVAGVIAGSRTEGRHLPESAEILSRRSIAICNQVLTDIEVFLRVGRGVIAASEAVSADETKPEPPASKILLN